ncbi:DUF4912 domain-containing protein [Nodosilinea sp. E11]|uniref:DUF4912 domain-containing protein n=1 Tax=Nodosilinea sp. E11 TaxID=3037479 RepID=UPI00293415A3|nr:DUF4912 domain-containing protein [Nodosilinea sp. E11]WOD41066.1 DUF4912 domain-containing protein [Nodosilinea sp. E11]
MSKRSGVKAPCARASWQRSLRWAATAPLLVAVVIGSERYGVLLAQANHPREGGETLASLGPGSRLAIARPLAVAASEATLDATAPVSAPPLTSAQGLPWWPWLLALPLLGGLLWWLLKDRAPVAASLTVTPSDRRIVLTPRDCRAACASWEMPELEVEALRQQNYSLALKLHDVTDIADVDSQAPHHTYPFACDTVAVGDQSLPVAVDNRDYLVELGYGGTDDSWHALARSAPVRVPVCPSPVAEEAPGGEIADVADVGSAALAQPLELAPARVVLTPRDRKNAYAYWELPPTTVAELKAGSRAFKARLYDVTELPGRSNGLNSLQEFKAPLQTPGELHLPIAIADRDYLVEIGYVNSGYQWQVLAKSEPVRVPAAE